MAVEVTEEISFELRSAPKTPATQSSGYSGLAVLQGDRWMAISLELGTVSEGASANEALDNLEAAVTDVLEIAAQEHLPSGEAVTPDEIARLIVDHRRQSGAPVSMRSLVVPT
jgi:hypothetical protein